MTSSKRNSVIFVMAIIAILASLRGWVWQVQACPSYADLAYSKCRDIHDAVTIWIQLTKAERFPSDLNCIGLPLEGEREPFMVIESDPWGQPYRIEERGPRAFRVCSNGVDTELGTDDDICYPED